MYWEASLVKLEKIYFTKSSSSLKIMQISDIHIRHLRVSSSKVKKLINKYEPDYIIMTGDYIQSPKDKNTFIKFLKEINDSNKIYMCLGNHDYEAYRNKSAGINSFIKAIESTNAVVLNNESVTVIKHGRSYSVTGFGDFRTGNADINKALKSIDDKSYAKIAFTHNPDLVLELPVGSVDYLLCGHFHGGQIWAPFKLEFKMLRCEKLCKMGYTRGLHKINGINVYLNRGLGNVLVPFRFLSRPEITMFYMP